MAVANPGHRRVQPIVRIVNDVLRIQITPLDIGIDRIVVVGGELRSGLVIETLSQHVHRDQILPVAHSQS